MWRRRRQWHLVHSDDGREGGSHLEPSRTDIQSGCAKLGAHHIDASARR
jgi:hypothetical protein